MMFPSCYSSASQQDLGDDCRIPCPTSLDTESDSSDVDDLSAGIDLPTLLKHVDLPLRNPSQLGPHRADAVQLADKDVFEEPSHCDLLRTAIRKSNLLEDAHMRRRINQKVPCDSRVLHLLFEDPDKVQSPKRLSRSTHASGLVEFRRWILPHLRKPYKEAESLCRTSWKNLSIQQKYHWYVIRKANGHFSCLGRRRKVSEGSSVVPRKTNARQRKADMPGIEEEDKDLPALGLLLTYQPTLGYDDPEIGARIRDGVRGDALREELSTRGAHRAYFDSFSRFIKLLRDKLGFLSCCAAVEMGDQSRFVAQVHCHAYIGFLRKDCMLSFAKQVLIPRSDLVFCNVKPYVVATRNLRGRRLHEAVSQAMHYVVGPKSSCIFRVTDLEPIQDVLVPVNLK